MTHVAIITLITFLTVVFLIDFMSIISAAGFSIDAYIVCTTCEISVRTAWMHRLVCAFVVRIQQSDFSRRGLVIVCASCECFIQTVLV